MTPTTDTPSPQPSSASIAIEIDQLTKSFQKETPILDRFQLKVSEGEFLCILGPSGCGKSTLLRLIAGLESVDSGEISFPSSLQNPKVAYVFQQPNLLPWRTVEKNIGLPLELKKQPQKSIQEKVLASLESVGLSAEVRQKLPSMLSGGMQMRASLARAIITEPKILLLDEPFGALDEVLRHRLNEELFLWAKKNRWTVLFVTHSVSEAAFLGTRSILMNANGKIVFQSPSPFDDHRNSDLRSTAAFTELSGELSAQLRNLSIEGSSE